MRTLTADTRAMTPPDIQPHGCVHVGGTFAAANREHVETLLWREAQRAHLTSPAARILACDDDGSGGLLVTTSTEHLAHRLGRLLRSAHGGEVHHGFSHNNRLAFVWWRS